MNIVGYINNHFDAFMKDEEPPYPTSVTICRLHLIPLLLKVKFFTFYKYVIVCKNTFRRLEVFLELIKSWQIQLLVISAKINE